MHLVYTIIESIRQLYDEDNNDKKTSLDKKTPFLKKKEDELKKGNELSSRCGRCYSCDQYKKTHNKKYVCVNHLEYNESCSEFDV